MSPHEAFCPDAATQLVAVRGLTPAKRAREAFASLPAAKACAATFGDGRTMIYAVTAFGKSAHITNA